MKFDRVIGKIEPLVIEKAEQNITTILLELASNPKYKLIGSKIGGDPFLFAMLYATPTVATTTIPTAATNGKALYFNPYYVNSLSLIGLRLLLMHEGFHCIFLHPTRIGHRNTRIWNIATDFVVNGISMLDLKHRGFDPASFFATHYGQFITLKQTLEMYQNPILMAKKMGWDLKKMMGRKSKNQKQAINPEDERAINTIVEDRPIYFADPFLTEDDLLPEKIYEQIMKVMPHCEECGELGQYHYPLPKLNDNEQHGQCSGCGAEDHYDLFGMGDTMDDHIDVIETPENIAKRLAEGVNMAKQLAGNVSVVVEREIGNLTAPQIHFTDFIRLRLMKARQGGNRNDYSRYKTRPMFSGLLIPKRKGYKANFGVLLDVSTSMRPDNMALGLSQLQAIDDQMEATLVQCDSECHWKKAIKLKRFDMGELSQIKAVAAGGTRFAQFFAEYEKQIGHCDFLVILTDGMLDDEDIAAMKMPKCPVYWVIVSSIKFNAPFGKVFQLHN